MMGYLISRSELLKRLNEYVFDAFDCDGIDGENVIEYQLTHDDNSSYIIQGFNDVYELLKDVPTVDAVPVVHGEWIFGKNHGEFVEAECSHCKGLLLVKWYDEIDKYRFCPNCGVKMDGKKVQE